MVIDLRGIGPEVHGKLRLDAQHVSPLHRPVISELGPLQEAVNQEAALVLGVRVLDEVLGLLCGRHCAKYVNVSATDEHRVGAQDGLDVQLGQLCEDKLVNLAGGYWGCGALEDIRALLGRRGSADSRRTYHC